MTSQYGDNKGTISLYEQIYAIAGITQFYRITLNKEALADIKGERFHPSLIFPSQPLHTARQFDSALSINLPILSCVVTSMSLSIALCCHQ
jgi:hypothetical protein